MLRRRLGIILCLFCLGAKSEGTSQGCRDGERAPIIPLEIVDLIGLMEEKGTFVHIISNHETLFNIKGIMEYVTFNNRKYLYKSHSYKAHLMENMVFLFKPST